MWQIGPKFNPASVRFAPLPALTARAGLEARNPAGRAAGEGGEWMMNWIFLQTFRGSFSAVSTPIFASKYSLESSWRDLQDLHLCVLHTFAPLRSQNFSQKSSTFFRDWKFEFLIFFIFSSKFALFSAKFWWIFVRISRQIPENSDVCRFFT